MTTTQSTLNAVDLEPVLTVNDIQASVRFYEALGFGIDERWEDDAGTLQGAHLKAGNALISLTQDDGAQGKNRVKGTGFRLWITTEQDVDELAAAVKKAGLSVDGEPGPMVGRGRGFTVTDPDGFKSTVYRDD